MTSPQDGQRFAAIYAQNRGRVYSYAVSRAGRQLAEEVVSEVFLVAWRRFAELPDPPLPWLLVTARNVAASQFRAVVREQSIGDELAAWISSSSAATDDIAEQVTERIAVLTALATLPESDRELLTLVAWHGLSSMQAAQVIGCSVTAYFVRLHRARRRLERAVGAIEQAVESGGLAADASGRARPAALNMGEVQEHSG